MVIRLMNNRPYHKLSVLLAMAVFISSICPVGSSETALQAQRIWNGFFSSPVPYINITYITNSNDTGVWRTGYGYEVRHKSINLLASYGRILLDVSNTTYQRNRPTIFSCPPVQLIPYDLVRILSHIAHPNACMASCRDGYECTRYWEESRICTKQHIDPIIIPIIGCIVLLVLSMIAMSNYIISGPKVLHPLPQLEQLIETA